MPCLQEEQEQSEQGPELELELELSHEELPHEQQEPLAPQQVQQADADVFPDPGPFNLPLEVPEAPAESYMVRGPLMTLTVHCHHCTLPPK